MILRFKYSVLSTVLSVVLHGTLRSLQSEDGNTNRIMARKNATTNSKKSNSHVP